MIKTQFKTSIKAPAQKVYELMLGIKDKKTYEHWTAEFNPTSTYEGNWDKGSKIHFVGTDESGNKAGMVSLIQENEAANFVSIKHYGVLKGEEEITTGEEVEKWAGGCENYTFQETDGVTALTVDLDTVEEYKEYFELKYPNALTRLKELAEGHS